MRRYKPSHALLAACVAASLLMATGCGTSPSTRYSSGRDGPMPNPPSDLDKVPDAQPKVEPIRLGGANKPYVVDGKRYEPITSDAPLKERGLASWYGRKFHGMPTSIGEPYDMFAMTAAHPTMPLPSYARVRNPANGKEVIVRINDRGPFHAGRVIDLSYTAALKLGLLRGVGIVEVERITNEDIRSAAWRQPGNATTLAVAAPVAVAAAPPPPPATPPPPSPPSPVPPAAVEAAVPPPEDAVVTTAPPAPSAATSTSPQIVSLPVATAPTPAARGFWVQLGAFRQLDGAQSFQRRVSAELDWLGPLLSIFDDAAVHRLQAGPYASREEAGVTADRVRESLKLVPVIVERR